MHSFTLFGLLILFKGGLSQARVYPLLNQCHIVSLFAQDLTLGFTEHFSGTSLNCSQTHRQTSSNGQFDCTSISCQDRAKSTAFTLQFLPCSDPPALRVTQVETGSGIFVNTSLSKSETVALNLGGESDSSTAFLFFKIGQHTNQLSLGLEVMLVSTTGNSTVASYREIPLDRNHCPGAVPLTSDNCRVMRNVTQYLNYFFSNITTSKSSSRMAPECLLSPSCNDVSCTLTSGGYYNLSILPCQTPPALRLVTSGQVSFEHVTRQSEIVPFLPLPEMNLNITFEKIDQFFMGLALQVTNTSVRNEPFTAIPYVELLPNKSMCLSDDYTLSPLVSTCDVMSMLSQSNLPSHHGTLPCLVAQNCTNSFCRTSRLLGLENATIKVNLFSCFDPPAIDVSVYTNAGVDSITTGTTSNSKTVSNVFNGSELQLNVTVVQRKSKTLLGVQVTGSRNNEVDTLIPYHDIPISCQEDQATSQVTDTCKVMANLAQVITAFLANVTNKPEQSPECTVTQPRCNSIACSSKDKSLYNIDISPCSSPPTLRLEVQCPGASPPTFRHTYVANNREIMQFDRSTHFQVTMSYEVNLIALELLVLYDDGTHSFTLPAIPYVRIPFNSSDCRAEKPLTTNQHQDISTTPIPNDKRYQTTILALEVGVPSVLVFVFLVCCSLVLLCKCVRRRVNKTMNYSLLKVIDDFDSDESLEDDSQYFT